MGDLVKFQDRIYAKDQRRLLVWDSAWDSFRPCEQIVWNPATRQVEPFFGQYCSELFDIAYGFAGTKTQCIEFTDKVIDTLGDAREVSDSEFWRWTEQNTEWFFDRPIVIHPCVKGKPSRSQYLTIMNLRARTARRIPRQIRGTFKQRKH